MLCLAWLLAGGSRVAFASGGLAYAVGSNEQGQLGIGEDTWSPGASLMSDAVQVAADGGHSLFIVEVTADADADGVPDCIDLCPGTPAGAAVNGVGCPPADFDADGDVDMADFMVFQDCFNGPNRAPAQASCGAADADGDADVDVADFLKFQDCFNGPNRPPKCG